MQWTALAREVSLRETSKNYERMGEIKITGNIDTHSAFPRRQRQDCTVRYT